MLAAVACLAAGNCLAEVFDVQQGTNMSVAADPAGESLAIDLLGGLWRLPVSGGGAQALIPAGSGIAQPQFDPTGGRIVFQRWLNGQWDLWQLTLADGRYQPLTETPYNEREPSYAPDGRSIAFAADSGGSYQIWSLELATGALSQLTNERGESRFPAWSTSGELAYAALTGARWSVNQLEQSLRGAPLFSSTDHVLSAPSWRPGGGVLVYHARIDGRASDLSLYIHAAEPIQRRLTGSEDVFVGRVAWISAGEYIYAADGQLWRRRIGSTERNPIQLFAGASIDAEEPTPFEGELDAPGPHQVLGVNDLVRHTASGHTAFSALGDLWLLERDGRLVQLTDTEATDAWPDFSPAGSEVVFASDRDGHMQIWQLDLESGATRRLSSGNGNDFMPRFSPDGEFVAYLATDGAGPWDASALKLLPLDNPGNVTTLASELIDARDLSWRGRRIRLLARDQTTRDPLPRIFETAADDVVDVQASNREIAIPAARGLPSWQPAGADEPYVIQAGRIFDGIGTSYAYFVDIHIQGQRITNIVRRGQLPLPARVIDASNSTVVPGLIDVHAHHSTIAGSEPGRQWLRHGVTTVREVMAETRQAIERAETWDSGRVPGPRLVIAPASPPASLALPAGSPLLIGTGSVARGVSHDLAEQMARADLPLREAPTVLLAGTPQSEPMFAVSTLGRSYQDILGQLRASGAWLPSGLGALEAATRFVSAGELSLAVDRVARDTGRVAIGSDAPAVPYGSGFHAELQLLAKRNLATDQILRWATAGGALALGLSLETGTLEQGQLADLVIVNGDPLKDISELARIEAVVRGGIWYSIDDLQ